MTKSVVSVPYWVYLPRKTKKDKKVILNFNQYHNWHPHERNDIKQYYMESIASIIRTLPKYTHIKEITYTLYPKTAATRDTRNITTVVDKFFCDALVNNGIVPDDSYKYIENFHDTFGEVCKLYPRVEVTIEGDTE